MVLEKMKRHLEIKFPTLWVFLLLTCLSEIGGEGISCFKCTVAPPLGAREETSQICSQFDGSQHFQIYCPKSTLCMKRTIHHRLGNGSLIVTSVERGCASQLDVFQSYDYNQRSWQSQERIIQSAYEEGCFVGEDRGAPGGPPEYCYCRYPLCNSANSFNRHNFAQFVIFAFISFIVFKVS